MKMKNTFVYAMLCIFFCACTGKQVKAQTSDKDSQSSKAKTASDWKKELTPNQYWIMVEKGTEPPFHNAYFNNHQKGIYVSAATGEPLFSSADKFDSGSGWPSFSKPIKDGIVQWNKDTSQGLNRDEVVEKSNGLHLGHVFMDGPPPTHERYCIDSGALKFIPDSTVQKKSVSGKTATAYFASGCFWCTEAIFESIKGVSKVIAGYSGGHTQNPTYEEVGSGKTGHAESVEVIYDPTVISFASLIDAYFGSQNPTQVNGQGPDLGSQYRSIIYYQNDAEKKIVEEKKSALAKELNAKIAAEVIPFKKFWKAEDYHQGYEKLHPSNPYVQEVSIPRFKRFKKKFPQLLKKEES